MIVRLCSKCDVAPANYTYIYIYIYSHIILVILLQEYLKIPFKKNSRLCLSHLPTKHCVRTHMFVPLRVLTLRTSCLYTYIHNIHVLYRKYSCIILYSQVYMHCIKNTFVYESKLCNSHLSVPLRALTLRTFLYTYIYSQVLVNISYHG